jgi:hypothetical protein
MRERRQKAGNGVGQPIIPEFWQKVGFDRPEVMAMVKKGEFCRHKAERGSVTRSGMAKWNCPA